ncbi:MAG: glycosyltransferase [Ignavibacteria bacterium]|nr:glycosyltransferase [Ignavibacteria bacterium]
MKKGISIIVCCYNSADVIENTLLSLCNQIKDAGTGTEILLIDNVSSDGTSVIAKNFISGNFPGTDFRIIGERRAGLAFARERGFREAEYEYAVLCDDDNRLSPDYCQKAFELMESDKNIAAAGGYGNAVSTVPFPSWFEKFRKSYSTGGQADSRGDVTSSSGYVWGAGMVLRLTAISELYSKGFSSILSDRKGETLSSGGDVELCYALRLSGHRIYYEPSLVFDHFLKPSRLTWKYLRKLYRGFGRQKPLLEPYTAAYNGETEIKNRSWKREALLLMRRLRSYGGTNIRAFAGRSEGSEDVLKMEKTLGRLEQLVSMKKEYERNFTQIFSAEWISPETKNK